MVEWVKDVDALVNTLRQFPQSVYVGLTLCLQVEWQCIMRCMSAIGCSLEPIDVVLRERSIPAPELGYPVDNEFNILSQYIAS